MHYVEKFEVNLLTKINFKTTKYNFVRFSKKDV